MDDNSVMHSVGMVEGWIEKVAEEFNLSTDMPLKNLKIIQDSYVQLLRKVQTQRNGIEGIVDIARSL
jgi:hypothetical protein